MTDESDTTNDEDVRARILAQFLAKWPEDEAARRVTLLEEAIPRLYEYAKLHNARVDIQVHPEHLEHYVAYLQPRVRAILENVAPGVIDKVLDSLTEDERLGKIMRLVNLMDERAAARKAAEEAPKSED